MSERIEFANAAGDLRPEMFGEVVLQGKAREAVRIPADAVIHSGTKSVVFVALGEGKFKPREIRLGEANSEFAEVVDGLEQGEGVVVHANFLVDSESRLRASLAALSSSPAAPAGAGHADHGGAGSAQAQAGKGETPADPHAGHRR